MTDKLFTQSDMEALRERCANRVLSGAAYVRETARKTRASFREKRDAETVAQILDILAGEITALPIPSKTEEEKKP